MIGINKTTAAAIVLSVAIVSAAYVFKKETNYTTAMERTTEHKYNRCLHIAMSESRQSGKVIEIEQAKEICKNLQA